MTATSTRRRPVAGTRWSAVDLARALGQSYAPTAEQARVIEAPLDGPLLERNGE